jgi:hypothetical protein
MKRMPVFLSLCALALFAPCLSFAGDTNHELNSAIRAIHADFILLKSTNTWFSNYSEACLSESGGRLMIQYLAPEQAPAAGLQTVPQQPDQLVISYINLDQTNGFKYWNDFENVAACRFPSLNLKIYGDAIIRGKRDAELKKIIARIVVAECAKLQKRKSD